MKQAVAWASYVQPAGALSRACGNASESGSRRASRACTVRSLPFLSRALILEKTCSMGLKFGL